MSHKGEKKKKKKVFHQIPEAKETAKPLLVAPIKWLLILWRYMHKSSQLAPSISLFPRTFKSESSYLLL